jgi:(p)ppGpp synthase/HD superfamily hydrolase
VELTDRFSRALVRASEIHQHQKRKCNEGDPEIPYISHLLNVCGLVLQDGGSEDEAIAALLHDAGEDQGGEPMLDEIEAEFGSNVAEIVIECSDTLEYPKPPWRHRKEEYIARLPEASPSALRVSVADKLDNVRAILLDYRRLGEDLWPRFNAGRDQQFWYYRTLAVAFRAIDHFDSPLIDELDRVVTELEALAGTRPETAR